MPPFGSLEYDTETTTSRDKMTTTLNNRRQAFKYKNTQ